MTASPITQVAIRVHVKVNELDSAKIDGFQLTARVEQADASGASLSRQTGLRGADGVFGPAGFTSELTNAQALTDIIEDLFARQQALPHVGTSSATPGDTNVYEFSINTHGAVESAWETKFLPAACEIADAYGDAVADFRLEHPEAFTA